MDIIFPNINLGFYPNPSVDSLKFPAKRSDCRKEAHVIQHRRSQIGGNSIDFLDRVMDNANNPLQPYPFRRCSIIAHAKEFFLKAVPYSAQARADAIMEFLGNDPSLIFLSFKDFCR